MPRQFDDDDPRLRKSRHRRDRDDDGFVDEPRRGRKSGANRVVVAIFPVLGVIGLVSCLGVVGCVTFYNRAARDREEQVSEITTATAITITAENLHAEYEGNEVAADRKYKGKVIEITGVVEEIGKGVFGDPYVALRRKRLQMSGVQCYFSATAEAKLAKLTKGQTVTIRGRGDGYSIDVRVRDCVLLTPAGADKTGAAGGPELRGGGMPVEAKGNGEVLDGRNGNPIVLEFIKNPIAAEGKWIGKRVRFWNSVGEFDRDQDGWFVAFQHCDITVHIAAKQEEPFSKLRAGRSIEVEATLTKFRLDGRGGNIPYLWGNNAVLVGIESTQLPKAGKRDAKGSLTFDELRRLVVNKTPAQVLEAVGSPTRAFDDLNGNPRRWGYLIRGESPTADRLAWVWFKDGKVGQALPD
jgi:hypothetical protein